MTKVRNMFARNWRQIGLTQKFICGLDHFCIAELAFVLINWNSCPFPFSVQVLLFYKYLRWKITFL
jgi:hypothetical protein